MSETQEDYEVQELSPRERLVEGIKERKKFLLFCGAAVGVMAYFAFHHRAPVAASSHLAPPPSMYATVGSAKTTPAYSDSIARDSEKRNETAEKTGSSSMPTIMASGSQSELPTSLPGSTEVGAGTDADSALPDLPSAQDTKPAAPAKKDDDVKVTAPKPVIIRHKVVRPLNTEHVESYRSQLNEALKTVAFAPTFTAVSDTSKSGSTNASGGGRNSMRGGAGRGSAATESSMDGAGSKADLLNADSASTSEQFPQPDPGTILSAHFVGLVDSTSPGTVIATLDQGPYAGARLLGSFSAQQNGLLIQFNTMTFNYEDEDGEQHAKTMSIHGVAVNADTLGTNMVSYINHHIFARVAISLATGFAQGLGQAIQQSGSVASMSGTGSTFISEGTKSTQQQMLQAMGNSVTNAGSILSSIYGNIGTTIKVFQNTPFAVLFLSADNSSASTPAQGQSNQGQGGQNSGQMGGMGNGTGQMGGMGSGNGQMGQGGYPDVSQFTGMTAQ